jgi:RNA polymerase sigma-70 factor, ECF subfamily
MPLLKKGRDIAKEWERLQQSSDSALVEHARNGAGDALAVIVDRYRRLIFTVALRIVKNQCEAEDVTQTVFLEVYRKLEQFDPRRGTLKMWLLQFAYSRSINRRKYLEQRNFYTQLDLEDFDPFQSGNASRRLSGLSSQDAGILVRQSINMLSDKQQVAIESIYFRGLTLEETAEQSGDSLSAVRHRYYRGLMKLREVIASQRPSTIARRERTNAVGQLENAHLKPRPV